MLFLQHHHDEVDWDSVRQEWQKGGLQPYADGLCSMIGKWLKLDGQLCPTESDEARTEEYTLRDMGRTIPNGRHLHQRMRYYYGNREKLRFITGKGWIRLLGGVGENDGQEYNIL